MSAVVRIVVGDYSEGWGEVADNDWARLFEDMPMFLFPDYDDQFRLRWPPTGECVELRDEKTDHRVVFCAEDEYVEIRVSEPQDPLTVDRFLAVLRSQRTSHRSLTSDLQPIEEAQWRQSTAWKGVWETGWRHSADYKDEIAADVIEVLRTGLSASPERLRYRAWNNDGPVDDLRGISPLESVESDRPTKRGVPQRCAEWGDLGQRLDWALTTLPLGQVLVLSMPARGRDSCVVTFFNDPNRPMLHNECIVWDEAGLELDELNKRLTRVGWQWAPDHADGVDDPIWVGPTTRAGVHPTVRDTTVRTVATFRDVLGVTHPRELAFSASADPTMSYLISELGLDRADM
ncbi:hypothetical protein [Nocardia sp. NPDC046763]|uniref:TY-Chap domain-containing protein n=1 Tax=Nocardia sp. NPDC046763 TaxID=3155256 RepID=UPI0033E548A0